MGLTVKDRVARGAALLDRRRKNWRSKIDVDSLDMAHGSYCILGQLYGYYDDAPAYLIGGHMLSTLPAENGFDVYENQGPRAFTNLTKAWQEELSRG